MKKAILGKKIGMTQVFAEDDSIIPVTVIEAGPCIVVQKKTIENDGYQAVQVGFQDRKDKHTNKPLKGHFDKVNLKYKRYLKEFPLEDISTLNVGDEIKVDTFKKGEKVDITGISKGKGFQGTIKRWGMSMGRASHGSHYHRGVGAMAGAADPGKVFKGKKLPGHMGSDKTTIQNLEVVKIDSERNLILIKGAVPGAKGGLLIIKNTVKA